MLINCDICSSQATQACTTCSEQYCDTCFTFLHKGSKSKHLSIPLTEIMLTLPSNLFCEKHKDERLKVYCMECSVSMCLACSFLHGGHVTKDLDHLYYSTTIEMIDRKNMISQQIEDMSRHKELIETRYKDFEILIHNHFEKEKVDRREVIETQAKITKDLLLQLGAFSIDEIVDLENFHVSELFEHSKFRYDDRVEVVKQYFSEMKGFTVSIEPMFDVEFHKMYIDAYTNRTKDFVNTNVISDKLLQMHPLNLLALTLKAEARVGHELFKFVTTQSIYDAYDEFAVAECLTGLEKKTDAMKHYQISAEKGCVLAEHKLGTIYFNGDTDLKVTPNKKEAVKYFTRAAEKGFALSQYTLGYQYNLGDGVKKDRELSVKYYRMAAEQGYSVAEYKMGHCYENGIGLEENLEEAKRWYSRASQKGHEPAQNALDLLISKIEHDRLESESETGAVTASYGTIVENSKSVIRTSQPSLLSRARANVFKNNQILSKSEEK